MKLTKEQRIAKHKNFLGANWELISAFAWEHYQKEGRGMVVVSEEDFVVFANPQLKGLKFAYAVKDSDLIREVSGHFEAKEWGWLDSYEPNERIIVIVVREGGGTSGYLIGGRTRPSEAYAKQQAKSN